MELKLEIKKPKFWQKKWKIKKPTLYILEFQRNKWINTYWWGGNNVGVSVKFKSPTEVLIKGNYYYDVFSITQIVVGSTGTNLVVDGVRYSGYRGDKEGWTVFGEIKLYNGHFSPKHELKNKEELFY